MRLQVMITNWLRDGFLKAGFFKKNSIEKEVFNSFIKDFLSSHSQLIPDPFLSSKINNYYKSDFSQTILLFPEVYLNLEEALIKTSENRNAARKKLRDSLPQLKDSILLDYPNIQLIFTANKVQEKLLCSLFQTNIVQRIHQKENSCKHPSFVSLLKTINISCKDAYLQTEFDPDFINTLRLQIYNLCLDMFGKAKTTALYFEVYQYFYQSYSLLDTFPTLLRIIPKAIFGDDLVNLPSKSDMFKMLQNQLISLEEVNNQLTEKINERNRIEDDLKQSENIKTRILDTAMDGIILTDQDGIVLDWNKQAENILKVQKKETVGTSIYRLVPYKLRELLKISFASYLTTGKGQLINKRIETEVPLKDESIIYVELTIIAIHLKNTVLFNAFFRDITDRKLIEKEIKEAKEIAEKSALTKSTFLSNMSHEIRTPLNVILGLTHLLQKSNFTNLKQDVKNLEGIRFSAENLLILINDILDFSKIEAGKLTVHPADFNLFESIDNLSRGFLIKANEKGIDFKTKLDPSLPKFIKGDQHRLHQILTNLLGNAIKFTRRGNVTLSINLKAITFSDVTLEFLISDTGVGIPEEKMKHIFESFYQVHAPGKHKFEGTGLGLSISKQLIELQGGVLNATSILNTGSTFSFSLRYQKSKFIIEKNTRKKSKQNTLGNDISNIKLLVVEDNKMNRFFISQLLSNWNILSKTAKHGAEALELLETEKFDIILMDMHMPVMDGLETTLAIRAHTDPAIKNLPVICCSADVYPEAKKAALESGMDYYLTKPIHEDALEKLLYTIINTKESITVSTNSKNKQEITQTLKKHRTVATYCNFSFIQQTFDNDLETVKAVLDIFLQETPLDFKNLQKAIQMDQVDLVKAMAHKIKSSYKTLGINREAQLLQELENLAVTNEALQLIKDTFKKLHSSLPSILDEVKNQLNNYSSVVK